MSKYSKVPSNAATFALLYIRDVQKQKNGWQFAALKGGESLPAKPSLVPVGCMDALEMDPHRHSVLQNSFNYDERMFKLR